MKELSKNIKILFDRFIECIRYEENEDIFEDYGEVEDWLEFNLNDLKIVDHREDIKIMFNRFTEFISHNDYDKWGKWIEANLNKPEED